ncbi:MAG: SusC/RagA family TonB-linked outer membrane protein [Ferruginibacter sp.]
MRKLISTFVVVIALVLSATAQNRTISGRVADVKGNPIPNASVRIEKSNKGTATSADGMFTISISPTVKTLIVSAVGMAEKKVVIGSASNLSISLERTQNDLSEVVVVGYGTAKKMGSQVGSITQVSGKAVSERPTGNALDALQGRVAGLQVLTSTGEPTATPSISLNGVGSLTASSTPLFVMDGIPLDQGTILSLNPEDFESISVLKDASATSIYGSRAANGVIYITTKKGSANKDAVISLQSQYGFSNLINTDYFNNFMNTKQLTDFWVASGYQTQAQVDATLAKYPNDTKWYKQYYKENAPSYQANLSVAGGGGKTTYYISGGYFHQEGLAYRSGYDRYTFRSNLNSAVTKWLNVGMNLSGGYDQRQSNPYGTNNTNRGLALLAQPFYSPTRPNGVPYYDTLIPGWGRYPANYLADVIKSTNNNIQFNPSAYIQITPVKNLTLKTTAGMDAYDYRTSSVQLPSYRGSLNNGNASESFTRGVSRTITNTGEYKINFGSKHHITTLIGQEYTDNITTAFNGSSTGQSDDRLVLVSAGPNNKASGSSRSENAFSSYFGRLEYSFNNKYYFTASGRQDQASIFGKDNRTGKFWSLGGMWKAKQEDFLSNVTWLSDLTVRANIGTSGNSGSITNYQSLANVSTTQYDVQSGLYISSPGNPNLSWESQKETTIGLQFGLFNRLNFDIMAYKRVTTNMLLAVPYPFTSGFSSVYSNVGALENKGIDLNLDANILTTKNAYITANVNFNYNANKITELFQGKQYYIIPNTGVSWAVGQPVSFFYPVFAQVNPQTGLPEWYQPNANPDKIVINQEDKTKVTSTFNAAALQQSTGIKRNAPFNGGFGASGGFGGFFMDVNFAFSKGKYLINNDRYFFENPNQFAGFNQSATILDYWKNPGDVSRFPKYGVQFTQFDSRLIEDASFVRLKSLTIGYNVPKDVLTKTHFMKGAKFYVTGRNLWTKTNYSGPDPEVDSNLTLGANPNTKQIVVGLNFQF